MSITKNELEEALCAFPLFDYKFISTEDIIFSKDVRTICETNDCGRYGKSWACPPVIGAIEECIERTRAYPNCLVFSTVTQVADSFDMQGCLDARGDHEDVTYEIAKLFREKTDEPIVLSTGCMACKTCSYPDAPCRFPERAFPTIESYGILIMQLAAQLGMSYDCGQNMVTYFSMILYK